MTGGDELEILHRLPFGLTREATDALAEAQIAVWSRCGLVRRPPRRRGDMPAEYIDCPACAAMTWEHR